MIFLSGLTHSGPIADLHVLVPVQARRTAFVDGLLVGALDVLGGVVVYGEVTRPGAASTGVRSRGSCLRFNFVVITKIKSADL